MKITVSLILIYSILIGLQSYTDGPAHTIWWMTYYFMVAVTWVGLVCTGLILAFIKHPWVTRRIRADRNKFTPTSRGWRLIKSGVLVFIWLVILNSPWMALGQLLIAAMVWCIFSELFDNGY